jgi:glycosyltransferase involved in cell wall biosynthesis
LSLRVVSVITRLARGGSERRLYDVLRAIPADHTIVVGIDSEPAVVERLAADHEVITCADLVRSVDPRRDARTMVRLVSLLRARDADVLHTHQSKAGLLGRLAARTANVPVTYHSASMASFGPGYGAAESRAFALAERTSARLVTRYFVVGTDLADRMARNGVPRHRLQIVRSSLDLRTFTPPRPDEVRSLRERFGIDPARRVVCYVGSLEERKGVTCLPRVVAGAADGLPVTLLVAGDGPARATLAASADGAAGPVELRLLGHVQEVAEVMRASDVLVLPSSAEGLPQVLVQAAACALPFVAYQVDGVGELIARGAVGRAVPAGDQVALTRAVAARLAEPTRPDASAAPSAWDEWDPELVATQYREAYERDLGRAIEPPRAGPITG